MDRHRLEEPIKKGPWTAEEDEVLINFVNRYGPREWSSIRTMGLLPRTGKSCRLRWVNKLRPNLKIGCKFSVEEERVVIDLQAKLGNKWAAIASFLPGRTDNDVKNFWSTRQKRLARLLQIPPSQRGKPQKSHGKAPLLHNQTPLQGIQFNAPQVKQESSPDSAPDPSSSSSSSCMGYPDLMMMQLMPLPDLLIPDLSDFGPSLPLVGIGPMENDPTNPTTQTQTEAEISFTHLPSLKPDPPPVFPDQTPHDSSPLVGLGEKTCSFSFLDVLTSNQASAGLGNAWTSDRRFREDPREMTRIASLMSCRLTCLTASNH
ncbi:hypothetical protein NMG60_11030257, partial [Bertholletia excelsa]